MLPRKLRLNPKEIPNIAKIGKRFSSPMLDVKVWYDSNILNSVFAISISTKIDKRAVFRNTIKRRIRSILRTLDLSKIRKGKYLLIVRSRSLLDISEEELITLLKSLLYKL